MATTLFFRTTVGIPTAAQFSLGTNSPKLDGTASGWAMTFLATTRGSATSAPSTGTVTGPTAGVEIGTSVPFQWVSPPLDADVTISGTITLNLWASESNMSANVAINAVIERIDSTGAIVSTIATSTRTTELAVGPTRTVNNFTVTPTSTNMLKGDRIRVRVFGDDVGTMASGFTFDFGYSGATGGADGDSFVTFTETFGLLTTDPTTTTLYPTETAASDGINPDAWTEKEMWTSRGSGAFTNSVTSVTGWTAPLQSGGTGATSRVFYTRPLTAFTLAAPVLLNLRGAEENAAANAAIGAEIAVTASDGTGAIVWGQTVYPTELTTVQAAYQFYIAGDDLAITDGQRLRLRVLFDDSSSTAMASGWNLDHVYAGTSAAASGDTYLTFGQTLTEFVTAAQGLPPKRKDDLYLPTRDFDPWSVSGWR